MSDADVIIIGTGIGGGTLGRQLAEAGLKVLFLEKGKRRHPNEVSQLQPDMFEPTGRFVRGLWPAPMKARVNGQDSQFYAPIGAGVGGSSAFYAATLERPERHDIDQGRWPMAYADLVPHYAKAEQLFEICGAPDPLSQEPAPDLIAPPPLNAVDQSLKASFEAAGLHPYQLHAAIRYDGHGMPRETMDGRTAGVEPALATGNARLIDRCDVLRIDHTAGEVHTSQGVYTAPKIVLSGGAFGSARLFMRSSLPDASGLAGRNLMFHLNEMMALWPKERLASGASEPSKALSIRDLYQMDGTRFGTVQAMGIDVGYGEIVHFLNRQIAGSLLRHIPAKGLWTRLAASIGARLFGEAKIFVGLLEDLPYAENRVIPTDDDTLAFDYTMHPELIDRRRAFRKTMARGFKGHRKWFLNLAPELNTGHPCGTLCMGDDPARSVVDAGGRVHGTENIYVADASLFPTSLGVNPSLTIAALALHVGAGILEAQTCSDPS